MTKYKYLSLKQLQTELERCESCLEKPCQKACPSDCSPADFILAARGLAPQDLGRAAEDILRFNPLGHVCGIVCPDSFCMAACSRKTFDSPIRIPEIQATIIHLARAHNTIPKPEKPALNGKRVAIVGAGPAGLAACAALAPLGYEVDLLEAEAEAGGACLQIPDPRLPKQALKHDVAAIFELGAVTLRAGASVKDPARLLQDGYDAVVLSVGQPEPIKLQIPGEELAVQSVQYLKDPRRFPVTGRVAVIGGGAVAADCATTAKRLGARSVELFVRRTLAEMPLTDEERRMLLEHRIDISTRTRPQSIMRESDGKLAMRVSKTEPGDLSADAKARGLVDIVGTSISRPGFDLIILATGNTWNPPANLPPGIFLAGDCIHGASTVVEAVASGKNAAMAAHAHISKTKLVIPPTQTSRSPSQSRIKSHASVRDTKLPVELSTDFFGTRIPSPFLLSAAPHTDGLEQMKRAYEAGWCGGVMKTAFDGIHIHIPDGYMVSFDKKTYGNADNVSAHPLSRVCREIEQLRKLYPDRLTMGSTGGPVTGHDEDDCKVWQSNTRKLENAGARGVEYSLSCPQGGDGTDGNIVSQNAAVTAKVIDWVMTMSDPRVPKLFKLTASVTSIKPILRAVKQVFDKYPEKKAGITLANSFPVLAFRPAGTEALWDQGVVVGMSGEGVLPISYLTLAEAFPFGLTISGNGGVMNYQAAAHFLALGARSVQVCTIVMKHGLGVIHELESGLSHFMQARGLRSVAELVGRAQPGAITGFNDLSPIKKVSQVDALLCQSCGNCVNCPYLAIKLDGDQHPVTDPSRCVGCSWCANACFAGALSMRKRTPAELAAFRE